ncbi:hypothetical protein ACO2Q3_17030 [Caulobacter sp. KR2-114]|uniref:hypothetical protein n=1 Tax=Caulobacter sp. KR2-114 TaxID=3400912 RepID=UPI003C066F8F
MRKQRSVGHLVFAGRAARVIGAGLLALAMPSVASAAPYYPAGLGGAELARVESICQTTLGLSPKEVPSNVWGAAQDPRLDPGENHFQGCVMSLSDELGRVDAARATSRADADCRARGLAEGSPALAECVYHAREAGPARLQAADVPAPLAGGRRLGDFFTASPHEIGRRERLACAQLGLEPGFPEHDACVSHIEDTFFRIDNPQS